MMIQRKSGFRREGPQFEPKPKDSQIEFKCDKCDFILESQGLLEAHRKSIHQPKSNVKCDQCDSRFAEKSQLEIHMKNKHVDVEEYNCNDCSFQGDGEMELQKHVSATHRRSGLKKDKTNENPFPCHSCGKTFTSKWKLMNHRKEDHFDILRSCRYFLEGDCAYEDNICWYKHEAQSEINSSTSTNAEYKCNFCDHVFERKAEFMHHRKTIHSQMNFKCREFRNGSCKFNESECWYTHDEDEQTRNENQNPVFQKEQINPHPPDVDLIVRLMDMVEKVIMKVELLEKSQNVQKMC